MSNPRTWTRYFDSRGIADVEEVVVRQPSYFVALSRLIESVPLSDWKTYLNFHLLRGKVSFLTQSFDDANFEFYGKVLSGQEQPEELWKRGVKLMDRQLGEVVSAIYVKKHFKKESKDRMVYLAGRQAGAGDRRFHWRSTILSQLGPMLASEKSREETQAADRHRSAFIS